MRRSVEVETEVERGALSGSGWQWTVDAEACNDKPLDRFGDLRDDFSIQYSHLLAVPALFNWMRWRYVMSCVRQFWFLA